MYFVNVKFMHLKVLYFVLVGKAADAFHNELIKTFREWVASQ